MSAAARLGLTIALLFWAAVAVALWWCWPVVGQLIDTDRPRTFYIPSENMLPTLRIDDRLRPKTVAAGDLRIGAVVVFQEQESARVARIAAMAGDTVRVLGGQVSVNGHAASLRDLGPGPSIDGEPTRMQRERLPGEAGSHRILDSGDSVGDAFGPVRVPAGVVFVLGDNRDHAADSRFPVEVEGVGPVATDQIIGVADRLLWGAGFRQLGRPIDGPAS